MALSAKHKSELARLTLPTDAETMTRATYFRQRSGLTLAEFAEAIGYSPSSLSVYLGGKYGGMLKAKHEGRYNTRAIRAALKQYMDKWEEARNWIELPEPQPTKDFLDVRKACMSALRGGMAYVLDGPPGTQKTFSLLSVKHEINQLADGSRAIRVYARIDHSPQSFLQECCNEAGISSRGTMDQLIRKLRFFLSGPRILFMVDEAQHLDHKGLEILRQLLDEANFGVILAGSHDLSQRLSHWQMEQWRSRVRKTLYLNGPSQAEAREILRAELGELTDADCDETVAACQATASRSDAVSRKPVTFTYISARDLFGAIERAKDVMPIQIHQSTQKAGAA